MIKKLYILIIVAFAAIASSITYQIVHHDDTLQGDGIFGSLLGVDTLSGKIATVYGVSSGAVIGPESSDRTWWNTNLTATDDRTHNANKKFSLVERLNYWWTKAGVLTPTEIKQDSTAIGLKAEHLSLVGYGLNFITCDEGDQQIVINPGASGDIRLENLQTVNDPSVVVSIDGGTGQLYKSPISESTFSPGGSGSNLDSDPTFTDAIYTQFGNNVWISGAFTADPNEMSAPTQVSFTPPIYDADFAYDSDAGGVAFCGTIAGMGASIHARTGAHTIIIEWISTDVSSQTWTYFLQYRITH